MVILIIVKTIRRGVVYIDFTREEISNLLINNSQAVMRNINLLYDLKDN